jgi:hypothetical protein
VCRFRPPDKPNPTVEMVQNRRPYSLYSMQALVCLSFDQTSPAPQWMVQTGMPYSFILGMQALNCAPEFRP